MRNPQVKSLLVEMITHLAEQRQTVDDLAGMGFLYSATQVAAVQRKEGAFKGVGDHVFRR